MEALFLSDFREASKEGIHNTTRIRDRFNKKLYSNPGFHQSSPKQDLAFPQLNS